MKRYFEMFLIQALVAQHGAVVTSVNADGPFQNYAGGIFAGCTSSDTNHEVTVVGYGSEGGVDFWLIKNSWSDSKLKKTVIVSFC